ncbi:MAG: hypothetical protein WDN27_03825 [Candidatus Saccharibacteria bacterium]
MVWAAGDWGATNDTTVASDPPTGGTQDQAAWASGKATMFAFHWDKQGAADTTNYGISGYAPGNTFTKLAVEIKGTATQVTHQSGLPVTNYSGTNRTSITQAVTVVPGNNSILVVRSIQEDATDTGGITGITFNGVALAKLDSVHATTWSRVEIWYLVAPDTTTANLVINKGSFGNNRWGITVDAYDNVNPSLPWGTTVDKSSADSGTSDTRTAASFSPGDMAIDALSLDSTGPPQLLELA